MQRIGRRVVIFAVVAVALAGFAPASALATGTRPAAGTSASSELTLQTVTPVDARMTDYTFSTPELPDPETVRVVLPVDYPAHPAARYPVEYLLGGCCTPGVRQAAWTDPAPFGGDAEALTAPYGLISVIPDGGLGSMDTDWSQPGLDGRIEWESFFVDQLLPWVDSTFRTVRGRGGRAIAGVSMGGFGAASIAARHPDLFAAVASFSGIVDTNIRPWLCTEISAFSGGLPGSLWGPRSTDEVVWRGHNPTDLAMNLGGDTVFMDSGNGIPGIYPDPYTGALVHYLDRWDEYDAHQQTSAFAAALTAAKVPFQWDDYGNGLHVWPYWRADLQRTLPALMALFQIPAKAPAPFSFTAIEPAFSAWGYTVTMTRKVTEFATLTNVTARGFGLSGSGAAVVRTAGRYSPGQSYAVTVTTAAGRVTRHATADSRGRLGIHVILGPSNTVQQYLPGSAPARRLETAQVTIAGA